MKPDNFSGFSSNFCVGFGARHKTPKEGRSTHRLKRCEYINKEEDYSPNTLNDEKYVVNQLFEKFDSRWIYRDEFVIQNFRRRKWDKT